MTTISPLTALPAAKPETSQLREVSQQFEAIFVRQMLAEARKTHFGGDDVLGGQGVQTFRQMQDDRFADIAAQRGSFGLAKMIEAQLGGRVSPSRLRGAEGVAQQQRLGEGLLGGTEQQALPQPLPQAGGESASRNASGEPR